MYTRILAGVLQESVRHYPVVSLMGPRQSGKTTLVKALFPEYAYANLERPDLRRMANDDPKTFLASFPPPAIFDEVQRVPELLSWIQVEVDSIGKHGLYILTGSNQPELGAAITQSLAGRTTLLTLLPLSLEELRQQHTEFDRDTCLVKGCLPRIYQEHQPHVRAYQDYLATYVERDMRQLVQVRDLGKFDIFLRLLAGRTAQILNVQALSTATGVSATTIEHWISVLEASFIVFRLQPWFANLGKRLVKRPKLYFTEPGLAASLLQIETPEQAARDPLLGALFENMVIVEILKGQYNRGMAPRLSFFRDSNGNEVDCIIEKDRIPYPVEIKAARTYSPAFNKGIKYFQSLGITSGTGTILYGGSENFRSDSIRILGFADACPEVLEK